MRVAVLMCFFLAGSLAAQIAIRPLHPDGIETNEPSIAIDPVSGYCILGSNTSNFFISENQGVTWKPKYLNPKEGFYGDPVTYIGKNGHFYLCHLAKNPVKKWPAQFDRIVFERSTDKGNTFASTGVGYDSVKMQDKPWFFVDEEKRSPFRGRIYLAWTEFDKYGSTDPADSSRIRFAWSTDDGISFSESVVVSDSAGDASDDDNTLEGATMAVGKNGIVMLVWAGRGKIWMDISRDGGKTWGKDRVIAEQHNGWNTPDVNGLLRSNSMPFVAADRKGRFFVVFGDNRFGDQDVFYIASDDKGNAWTEPRRVHHDAKGNGKEQFMPALSKDRYTGDIYMSWYDRRLSANNRYTDVYASKLDFHGSGKEIRITPVSFCVPSNDIFFGDYSGLSAAKNRLMLAYTVYDADKQIVTVNTASLNVKMLKKKSRQPAVPNIQAVQLKDTALLYLHFELPGYTSCTLELSRGDVVMFRQLFQPLETPENEVQIPLSRLPAGVYHMRLTFKRKHIESDIYVGRIE